MAKEDFLIKVRCEGEVHVHIQNIGPTDHVTICGLDGDDPGLDQKVLPLTRGDQMNCRMCKIYYDNRKKLNINKSWIAEFLD